MIINYQLQVCARLNKTLFDKIMVGFVQWNLEKPFTAAISDATYSCDSQLVYVSFVDGSVGIFDAESFSLRNQFAAPLHKPQGVSG